MNVITVRPMDVEGDKVKVRYLWTKAPSLTEEIARNSYYMTLMPKNSKFDETTVSSEYPEPEPQTELVVHDDITDIAFVVELHVGVEEVY